MKKIVLFIWQLPQNIIGLIILLVNLKRYDKYTLYGNDISFYVVKHLFDCRISLGDFMLLDSDNTISEVMLKHEHGHQKQSLCLGPLYLIVIGLPSLIGNICSRIFHKEWDTERKDKWYYSLPWEKWADELGGVKR